jgi:hypothetical protein
MDVTPAFLNSSSNGPGVVGVVVGVVGVLSSLKLAQLSSMSAVTEVALLVLDSADRRLFFLLLAFLDFFLRLLLRVNRVDVPSAVRRDRLELVLSASAFLSEDRLERRELSSAPAPAVRNDRLERRELLLVLRSLERREVSSSPRMDDLVLRIEEAISPSMGRVSLLSFKAAESPDNLPFLELRRLLLLVGVAGGEHRDEKDGDSTSSVILSSSETSPAPLEG